MKNLFFIIINTILLVGCVTAQEESRNSIANFVMAGPISDDAQELSMRWRYGLELSVDPLSITEVKFSCEPIPWSTFSVKASDLNVYQNNIYANGPSIIISNQTTPWLYQNETTTAKCSAVISQNGKMDITQVATVNFTQTQKTRLIQNFTMAHEHNKKLKLPDEQ